MAWPKGRPNPHGGNRKGVPNKRTQATKAKAVASGIMPLDFMLEQLRDPSLSRMERMHAAATAAPYLHARLTSVDAKLSGNIRVEIVSFDDDERDSRKAA